MTANAEEPTENKVVLDEIVLTGEKLVTPTKQTNETVYTGSEITRKGLEAQGTKATVSIYEAINILPGISVKSIAVYKGAVPADIMTWSRIFTGP